MAYRIHSISCRSDAATSKEVVSFNTIHHLENKSNLPANTGSGPCGLASSPPPKKFIFDITQVYNKQIEYMIGLLSKANKFRKGLFMQRSLPIFFINTVKRLKNFLDFVWQITRYLVLNQASQILFQVPNSNVCVRRTDSERTTEECG